MRVQVTLDICIDEEDCTCFTLHTQDHLSHITVSSLSPPFSLSPFPVLSPVQVYMARCSSPPPAAPVHLVDDGLLHRPIARLRPQAPPD